MDTCATSHMASTNGNHLSFSDLSNKNGIVVGNGRSSPIHGNGNVLHAPKLIKIQYRLKNS